MIAADDLGRHSRGRVRHCCWPLRAERKGTMRTRTMTARTLSSVAGAAAVGLLVLSGDVRGDEDAMRIRWDIQHYPNLVLQAGGQAFADAIDGSKIKLTGSGSFKTDGHDAI